MAIVNYSPWQDAASVGQGLGASLTNLLIELPKLRQQQQLLQMHSQLYGAQAGLYQAEAERNIAQIQTYGPQAAADTARAGLYNAEQKHSEAQTTEITSAEVAKNDLGNAFLNIANAQQRGDTIGPHVSNAVNALARIPYKDRASLAETLAQMLEMDKPQFRTNLALGVKPHPVSVGPGATMVSPEGTPMYQSPRALSYGQQLFSGIGGDVPLATAHDRPVNPVIERLGSVYGAFARSAAQEAQLSGQNPRDALVDFLKTISGTGQDFGNRVVPPLGPNAPVVPRVRKYNPATGKLE